MPDLGTGRNVNWDAIGFPGPLAPPPERERPLNIRRPSAPEETIEADVCIVGSGAGGGVVAGELAAAGKSVVVLEAGEYHDDADFDGLELSAYQRMYLNGGPFPTAEGQVSIVAGTGVGGGTVINWTNCLRTSDHVRAEWAGEHGLSDLAESDYDGHLDAVFERLGVNGGCSDLSGPHQRLKEACEKLGYRLRVDHPQYRPGRRTRPSRPRTSVSATSRARSSRRRRPTSSTRRPTAPRSSPGPAPCGVLTEGGRAAGVEAEWSDPARGAHERRRPRPSSR